MIKEEKTWKQRIKDLDIVTKVFIIFMILLSMVMFFLREEIHWIR